MCDFGISDLVSIIDQSSYYKMNEIKISIQEYYISRYMLIKSRLYLNLVLFLVLMSDNTCFE